MELPDAWVDEIFTRLSIVYGSRFTGQWPAAAISGVKDGWAHELREFAQNRGAVLYALEHLPTGNVPNVLELRDIARVHVRRQTITTSSPHATVTPEERQRALDVLASFRRPGRQGPRDWARLLEAREERGERLSLYQRNAWRETLGAAAHSPGEYGATDGSPGDSTG